MDGESAYAVLDLSGKVTIAGVTQDGTVDVRPLEPGAYVLELVARNEVQRLPFVRE